MKNNITNTLCSFPLLCCLRLRTRAEKSFPAKLSNETSFKMDSILIWTRLLVNQRAHCSRSTTCREIQLYHTLTLVP